MLTVGINTSIEGDPGNYLSCVRCHKVGGSPQLVAASSMITLQSAICMNGTPGQLCSSACGDSTGEGMTGPIQL